jgi:hypothetical protein
MKHMQKEERLGKMTWSVVGSGCGQFKGRYAHSQCTATFENSDKHCSAATIREQRQPTTLHDLADIATRRQPCRSLVQAEEAAIAVAARHHSAPRPVQKQRVQPLLHAPEETTRSGSMLRREVRVKEEAERVLLVAMLREDEAEVVESQHLLQHLRPLLHPPKYKHQHRQAMSRFHPHRRPPTPTASRLYDPPHHSTVDIL